MRTQTIPDDLVSTQVEALRAYEALARTGGSPTAQRRRLIEANARVDAHPYWAGRTPPPGARAEVRRLARARLAVPEPALL
ncbi:hypothetical protein [Streptomyces sp. BH104]|uniref:hypothetical protein n=1 Tax=Streptomyces sp. BH104 TaxID=3410407 RepID=UPI003BB7AA26